MTPSTETPPRRFRRSDLVVLALCAVLVGLLYGLALRSDPEGPVAYYGHRYFDWQAKAWLAGQLHLPHPVPAELLALPDPYDPRATRALRFSGETGFHDLSLYQGKFYLYWGPTPTLVAFLPWRLMTGQPLSTAGAAAMFAFTAWLAAALLVLRTARQLFPQAGPGILAISILALAGCNWSIVTLARASVWETPIFSACCFGAIAWWLLAECRWARPSAQPIWLALASASWGLAIGSRPIWVVGTLVLLWPLWPRRAQWRQPAFWRLALAAVLPVTFCVLALLGHNYARFGSIFEFGQHYQLAEVRMGTAIFSAAAFLFNLQNYFFAVPQLGDYFPFVLPQVIRSTPPGYLGIEFTLGLLVVVPYFWCAWLLFRNRRHLEVTVPVIFTLISVLSILALFAGAASRYELEIALPLATLTSLGLVAGWPASRLARLACGGGAILLALVSTLMALLISSRIQVMEWNDPNPHPWLGKIANRVAVATGWTLADATHGIEMDVVFPPGRAGGGLEALMTSGRRPLANAVLVEYPDAEHIRFHYLHVQIVASSPPLPLARGVRHRLRIEAGAMLPPANHPFWHNVPAEEIERHRSRWKVTFGTSEFTTTVPNFPPTHAEPTIGGFETEGGTQLIFSGQIISPILLRTKR